MENNAKQCDISIYKSLCICSPEFERIPINRRDLGVTGETFSYILTISGAYIPEKVSQIDTQKALKLLSTSIITANFGIISFLIKLLEGKSLSRSGMETGIETTLTTLGGIGGTRLPTTLSQTSKLASSGATRLATSRAASNIAIKTGVSLLTRIATGAATGAAVGSAFPIVGTIIGAVAGTLLAGAINEQCEFDKNLPQKQKTFNDLGSTTENFLNIYLPANAGFGSAMSDTIYPKNRPFYVPNIPTITLGVNYGVIVYLFKKQRERVINE